MKPVRLYLCYFTFVTVSSFYTARLSGELWSFGCLPTSAVPERSYNETVEGEFSNMGVCLWSELLECSKPLMVHIGTMDFQN